MTPTTAERSFRRERSWSFMGGKDGDMNPRKETRVAASAPSSAVEAADGVDNLVLLTPCQLGIDGKRQHLGRCPFGLGARPRLIPQIDEAGLEVQRQRVVDRRPD